MYKYFFASAILHITLAMVFALWPSLLSPYLEQDNTIIISMVDIAEITNIKPTPTKKEAIAKEANSEAMPKPPAPTPPPEPPKAEPVAKQPPTAEVKIPPSPAEIIPTPQEKPKTKPEPKKAEPAKKPTLKPKPVKEKPKEKPKAKTKEFSESILKTLEETQMAKKEKKKKADEVAKMTEELLGKSDSPFDIEKPLSATELDLLRDQFGKYWNPAHFMGAKDGQMEVTLRIVHDIDGNILSVRPIKQQANSNPSYTVFIESAIRAAKRASPLQNMPKDKFSEWQEMEMHYDSRGTIH